MMEHSETFCTESVATVYEDARNLLAHIKFVTAVITKVKPSTFIISLDQMLV